MIFDAFMFFNELEVLELRLHELADVVDKFVLCEATRTFSNKPKPLYYADNKSRFSAFSNRIIHVVVDDSPDSNDAWVLDHYQKNCIGRALRDCRPDDVIMMSDADEIPRASTVAQAARELTFDDSALSNAMHAAWKSKFATTAFHRFVRKHHPYVLVFHQKMHNYFFNCVCPDEPWWTGTRMLHFRDFTTADEIRYTGHRLVENAGWHFTYLGGVERIRQKIASFAHQEFNTPEYTDPQRIAERLRNGQSIFDGTQKLQFVALDESYPCYLREHPERFTGLIQLL
jgi:beta-1,4-mannosyl-glycoprotein beta-1,4-N-acetylglucosaminyltransferase